MAPERRGDRLTPEQVSRLTFATSFRGYDPDQVRQFVVAVAEELREQRDREAALRAELEALHAKAAPDSAPLDEDALTAALGEETARVLTAARAAAQQIRAKGEESVARMLREAQDEAARLRAAAEAVLGEKTTAAQAAAAELVAAAEERAAKVGADADVAAASTRAEADAVLASAQADAERTKTEAADAAAAELEQAREQGRTMVHEAQLVRERVLKDLARKRKTARSQLEQLRAGRERLLEAYELVRRTLGEATGELSVALTEAKVAADAAVRRVEEEPEPTIEELEAEVEAAKLAGLPIIEPPGAPESESLEDAPAAPQVASETPSPSAAPTAVETPSPSAMPAALESSAAAPPLSNDAVAAPVDELPPLPDEIPPAPPTLDPIRPPRKGRRKRGVPELPPTELQPMSPRDPVEGMRVITGEVPAVPTSAAPAHRPTEAADEDELEPAEVAATEEALSEAAPAAAPASPPSEAEIDTDTQTEAETETDDEITAETEVVDVDDLFSRIRAARAAEVAKATEVLDATPSDEPETDSAAPAGEESAPAESAEPMTDDEALLERRDSVVDTIEQAATRKLKRVLADEQSEVLDRLRRTRKATLDALYADGIEAQLTRWSAAVEPDLEEAARGGADFHGARGATPRPTPDLAAQLAAELVNPLRDKVEAALRDADGNEDDAADGIRSVYREWKSKRIADHTRDAVFGAFGRGLYDALGADAATRWIVDDGGVPCPDCDDDALAGAVARGEPFPTGHCHPPAHAGCRCLLAPAG